AINLVAQTFGRQEIGAGDEIIVSTLEHHSNIVPWQQLARERDAVLRVAPVSDRGEFMLAEFAGMLNARTKLVAVTQVSNALGVVLPVAEIVQAAHRAGARVLVDGAQAVPHFRVDVRRLDADFYAFSGHKLFGPTGIGVLYGKAELLRALPPWQGGGSMIRRVSFTATEYNDIPQKFEAGTGNIAGAVGLGAALEYLERIDFAAAVAYEHELMAYALRLLTAIDGVQQVGAAPQRVGAISLTVAGCTPEEVGAYLDREGIAVRAGHHCAQPALQRFGVTATVRPSLAFYNTRTEIELLAAALKRLVNRQSGPTTRFTF
ncbi:MAG TPA: cysteine desulfurase, partial [bacterium]|nr:cysteine desulfurase [bacterium]